jgi:ureidoacrylate peracid hydrolase
MRGRARGKPGCRFAHPGYACYDTVLITGTVTNVCCESSARDAMMLNFKTIMVSDGNAARTDEEHNATLSTFLAIFGDVMDTEFLIQRLETNAALRVAAE